MPVTWSNGFQNVWNSQMGQHLLKEVLPMIFSFTLLMIVWVPSSNIPRLFYRGHARFDVFTVALLKIQVFWDVTLCHWPNDAVLHPRFQSSEKHILNYVTTYKSWNIIVVRQYYSQMKNNLVCVEWSVSALDILSRYVSRGMWALLPHLVGWSWKILYPWLAVQDVICWTQPGDEQCLQTSPLHLGLSYTTSCMWHW